MSFSSDNAQITNQLPQTINLPSIKDPIFIERLEELLRNISNSSNQKQNGLYTLEEKGSSEQYYIQGNPQRFRNVYRKVLDFVNLNGGNIGAFSLVSFSHGISNVQESAGIKAHCTATDGRHFTVVFPDVWIDATDAFFDNPIGVTLSQVDVVIPVLKEV
jgi:hypothetical protein